MLAAGSPSSERPCHRVPPATAHPTHAAVPPAWQRGLSWPFLRCTWDLASARWLGSTSATGGLAPGCAAVCSVGCTGPFAPACGQLSKAALSPAVTGVQGRLQRSRAEKQPETWAFTSGLSDRFAKLFPCTPYPLPCLQLQAKVRSTAYTSLQLPGGQLTPATACFCLSPSSGSILVAPTQLQDLPFYHHSSPLLPCAQAGAQHPPAASSPEHNRHHLERGTHGKTGMKNVTSQHTLPGDNFQKGFAPGSQVTLPLLRGKGGWHRCPACVRNWIFRGTRPDRRSHPCVWPWHRQVFSQATKG